MARSLANCDPSDDEALQILWHNRANFDELVAILLRRLNYEPVACKIWEQLGTLLSDSSVFDREELANVWQEMEGGSEWWKGFHFRAKDITVESKELHFIKYAVVVFLFGWDDLVLLEFEAQFKKSQIWTEAQTFLATKFGVHK